MLNQEVYEERYMEKTLAAGNKYEGMLGEDGKVPEAG